jgi:hypothetical protein
MEVGKPRPVAEEREKGGALAQCTSMAIGRTEQHRSAETSPQPVSWLMVPERDQGIRAPGSYCFVAIRQTATPFELPDGKMVQIAGLIIEAGQKSACGKSQ